MTTSPIRIPRRVRGALAAGALVAGLALALAFAPQVASAHARYLRSTPADGAVLPKAPARVDMWTDSEMFRLEGANTLTVTGPRGAVVNQGSTHLDDADRTHLWVELQQGLRPGAYTVAWQTLSADDQEQATGTFTFTVDPSATPSPAVAAGAAPSGPAGATTVAPAPASAATGGGGGGRGIAVAPWQAIVAGGLLLSVLIAVRAIVAGPAGADGD